MNLLTNASRLSDPQRNANIGEYMELAYLFPAAKIIQDAATKKYTYVDIFSTIFIPKDSPSIPQFFSVGGRILGIEGGDVSVDIRVVHENGTEVATVLLSGNVKKGDLDIAANFGPVTIDKIGKHFLKINYNEVALNDGDRFYFLVEKQK